MIWCSACQEHYEANHFKVELGDPEGHVEVHKTGVAYGHIGRAQAVEAWARAVWDAGQLTPQLFREGTTLFREAATNSNAAMSDAAFPNHGSGARSW